jgi:signal transduction histidine kinase
MRERVGLVAGRLVIASVPGAGTTITVDLPARPHAASVAA